MSCFTAVYSLCHWTLWAKGHVQFIFTFTSDDVFKRVQSKGIGCAKKVFMQTDVGCCHRIRIFIRYVPRPNTPRLNTLAAQCHRLIRHVHQKGTATMLFRRAFVHWKQEREWLSLSATLVTVDLQLSLSLMQFTVQCRREHALALQALISAYTNLWTTKQPVRLA